MKTDFVFVTYGKEELIKGALDSLHDSVDASDIGNIVVVDNFNQDDDISAFLCSRRRDIYSIRLAKNVSYALSCNLGYLSLHLLSNVPGSGNVSSQFVCFCNSDLIFTPGFLAPMVELCSPESPIVGPKLVSPDGQIMGAGVTDSFTVPRGWREGDEGQWDIVDEVVSVAGACMLVDNRWFRYNLFDVGYSFYWEDADLCITARLQGRKVLYCGLSKVVHIHRGSTTERDRARLSKCMEQGRQRFIEKWSDYPEFVSKV